MADSIYSMQVRIASGTNVLLGLSLGASPWLMSYATQETDLTRNNVVIGGLVAICAALRTTWPGSKAAFSGANIAFGIWTLMSAWTFDRLDDQRYAWISAVFGIAIMGFAAWSSNATIVGQSNQPFQR
jgi:SPW repeat